MISNMQCTEKWFRARIGARYLNKSYRQLITDHAQDRKDMWTRRFKKINGKLYVNIFDYRNKHESNKLTRQNIEKLYYALITQYKSEFDFAAAVAQNFSNKKVHAVYMYFRDFKFRDRRLALEIYLVLRHMNNEEDSLVK